MTNLDEREKQYELYHQKRFDFALHLISKLISEEAMIYSSVLEIGPWYLIDKLRQQKRFYINDSLGFGSPKIYKEPRHKHYEFNLLDIGQRYPPVKRPYQLVIASEVIEHLPVNMNLVFDFLNKLTVRWGFVLIQTPNAVSLKRRMAMLFGKNPFDHIVLDTIGGHAHIREYTMKELKEYAQRNGFIVYMACCKNYFSYNHSWKAKLYKLVGRFLPASFHDGITIILQKK